MSSRFLAQFLLRLAFGIAVSMGVTPPAWVVSGFFRIHLWVLLGIHTLAALAIYSGATTSPTDASLSASAAHSGDGWAIAWSLSVALAMLSYVGSVTWMYVRPRSGRAQIWLIAALALAAGWYCGPLRPNLMVALADMISSGLLIGATTTAMLLGHWYLNSPGMRMEPLRRLLICMGLAIALRAAVCGTGWVVGGAPPETSMLLVWATFRWLAGLALPAILARLAWQTLKIPNTQSATGILYAAVIVVFLGELVSQLLSADHAFPL